MVNLDIDDRESYGPETITIETYDVTKTYLLYVHDYTNRDSSSSVSISGATVELKPSGEDKVSLTYPDGFLTDRWWFIGSFSGNDGLKDIQISNTILSEPELSFCGPDAAELFILPPKDPILTTTTTTTTNNTITSTTSTTTTTTNNVTTTTTTACEDKAKKSTCKKWKKKGKCSNNATAMKCKKTCGEC